MNSNEKPQPTDDTITITVWLDDGTEDVWEIAPTSTRGEALLKFLGYDN